MAKRNRGSHRPGQRHQERNISGRPLPRPAARPSQGLSAEEEARAAELESQIVSQERAADASRARSRDLGRGADLERTGRARSQGLLAARAAEEYAYVARDVRRILQVGGLMAAALGLAWLLIDVLRVVKVG